MRPFFRGISLASLTVVLIPTKLIKATARRGSTPIIPTSVGNNTMAVYSAKQ